jgi:hypothetical protein
MKRTLFFFLLITLVLNCVLLSAQPKDLFVKSVPIIKILSHRLGYKVYYQKLNLNLGFFYVPGQWFAPEVKKATIIWGNEYEYPYFTLVWEKGEIVFIKLFLKENMNHVTWGMLRARDDQVREFFDIETLEVEF